MRLRAWRVRLTLARAALEFIAYLFFLIFFSLATFFAR